jgi:hypothetical protein
MKRLEDIKFETLVDSLDYLDDDEEDVVLEKIKKKFGGEIAQIVILEKMYYGCRMLLNLGPENEYAARHNMRLIEGWIKELKQAYRMKQMNLTVVSGTPAEKE